MPIRITQMEQFARLAAEARAVMTVNQVAEMAVSMDLSSDEVEDLFGDAEDSFDAAKNNPAIVPGVREQ